MFVNSKISVAYMISTYAYYICTVGASYYFLGTCDRIKKLDRSLKYIKEPPPPNYLAKEQPQRKVRFTFPDANIEKAKVEDIRQRDSFDNIEIKNLHIINGEISDVVPKNGGDYQYKPESPSISNSRSVSDFKGIHSYGEREMDIEPPSDKMIFKTVKQKQNQKHNLDNSFPSFYSIPGEEHEVI